MKERVSGKEDRYKYWAGKSILPKEIFILWAKNHPDFLRLYKQWINSGYIPKLAPSVNRIDSNLGYTLDNIEWVSKSDNSRMACAVRKLNNKKSIYKLLGVLK
jgi:hypothetical protein